MPFQWLQNLFVGFAKWNWIQIHHQNHHHSEIGRDIQAVAASEIGRDIHVAASEVKLDANLGGKLVLHNLFVYREFY